MSIRRYTVLLAALASFTTVLTLGSSSAFAALSEFSLLGEITREGGETDEALAVDESTGDVYVYDSEGQIFKYDADGKPADFSALGSNVITGVGSHNGDAVELAVDNSTGPAKGDIYMSAPKYEGGQVNIYGPDGNFLGALTNAGGQWGEACGVAVDGSGNVYVGLYPETIAEFKPSADPVSNSDYVGAHFGLGEICQVGADHDGRIYAMEYVGNRFNGGKVVRLDSFEQSGAKLLFAHASGNVTATNAPSDEVFVSNTEHIFQYDPQGNLLSAFGAEGTEGNYTALAINARDGRLYSFLFAPQNRKVQIWQGVFIPGVRTLESSGLSATGQATLNGSVDPEGTTVESCSFEYGSTTAYGAIVPCAQSTPMTGASVLPVSAEAAGLTLNHVYHYRLATTASSKEVNGSDQTFSILARPVVEDQQSSVSEVTRSTARLSGAVAPQQGETRYQFEYGTSEEYGDVSNVEHTGDLISGEVPISQEVTGLIPNTVYHYRLVASNVAGTTYGADHTFISGEAAPPSASTGGALNVAQNTATITGTVNTNGLPSSYGFEIATSTDYGPPTGLGYVGAGANEAPASLQLTGLQPGTIYRYRLTATNVDGTAYGADRTFTTTTYASTFAEPPAPLPFVAVPQVAFPPEAKQVTKKTTKKKTKPRSKRHKKIKRKKKK